jgi:hypothetical protein
VIRHLMPCLTVAGILLMAGIVVDSLRCRRQEGKEARGPSSVLLPSPRPHRASPGWAGLGAWCAGRQSVSHVVWAPPTPRDAPGRLPGSPFTAPDWLAIPLLVRRLCTAGWSSVLSSCIFDGR